MHTFINDSVHELCVSKNVFDKCVKASVQKKIIDQNSCVQNWNLHGFFHVGFT